MIEPISGNDIALLKWSVTGMMEVSPLTNKDSNSPGNIVYLLLPVAAQLKAYMILGLMYKYIGITGSHPWGMDVWDLIITVVPQFGGSAMA